MLNIYISGMHIFQYFKFCEHQTNCRDRDRFAIPEKLEAQNG
jgi:hypothetical protein